ncbi:MAG: hypothetical protein H0U00_10700, partial [Actinobacteria bacterium]|nr:hypothetical protein [Actinomycetota bacterium]
MIDAPTIGDATESARLAKQYFGLFQKGDTVGMLDLLHPEVEWVLKSTRPGEILRGKHGVEVFLDEIAGKFYDLVTEVYRPLDHEHVIVEGRLRWTDDERVLRDDPVIWALVFRDGL